MTPNVFIEVEEAARRLGRSPSQVRRYASGRRLNSIKRGGRYSILVDELFLAMESAAPDREPPTTEPPVVGPAVQGATDLREALALLADALDENVDLRARLCRAEEQRDSLERRLRQVTRLLRGDA